MYLVDLRCVSANFKSIHFKYINYSELRVSSLVFSNETNYSKLSRPLYLNLFVINVHKNKNAILCHLTYSCRIVIPLHKVQDVTKSFNAMQTLNLSLKHKGCEHKTNSETSTIS